MQNQSIETTFPKSITVFGVTVRGTAETPDANLIHAANILAQYLDNNGDGVPDNQAVVDKLASEKATLQGLGTPMMIRPVTMPARLQNTPTGASPPSLVPKAARVASRRFNRNGH